MCVLLQFCAGFGFLSSQREHWEEASTVRTQRTSITTSTHPRAHIFKSVPRVFNKATVVFVILSSCPSRSRASVVVMVGDRQVSAGRVPCSHREGYHSKPSHMLVKAANFHLCVCDMALSSSLLQSCTSILAVKISSYRVNGPPCLWWRGHLTASTTAAARCFLVR